MFLNAITKNTILLINLFSKTKTRAHTFVGVVQFLCNNTQNVTLKYYLKKKIRRKIFCVLFLVSGNFIFENKPTIHEIYFIDHL